MYTILHRKTSCSSSIGFSAVEFSIFRPMRYICSDIPAFFVSNQGKTGQAAATRTYG
jgi:hypothetical protein